MTVERARAGLRAIRREPLLLDDRLVGERLQATATLSPDAARWTRAWLVCWFATLAADERFGRDDPWEIPLRLDQVSTPRGGGDAARQRVVLDALARSGIARLHEEATGRRATLVARLSADVFAEHAAALTVDWAAVVAGCGGEPAALLVMRSLTEVIVPLDAPSAVPRRDLMACTGYQQKQVRLAVRRLAAADLIVIDGDVGTTARYRLTPRALGRRWPVMPEPAPALVAPPPDVIVPPAERPPSARANGVGEGVRLLVGGATVTIAAGATFEIGPGVAARLEIGPDGQPRLVVGRPSE